MRERIGHVRFNVTQNILHPRREFEAGYFIAVLADFIRRRWIATRESFTFETVMSGTDKMEFLREAREAGYRAYLYFICTNSSSINIERVKNRKAQGGHSVPRDKIEMRYERLAVTAPQAIALCDRAYLLDNSGTRFRLVAEFDRGRLAHAARQLPDWFDKLNLDES